MVCREGQPDPRKRTGVGYTGANPQDKTRQDKTGASPNQQRRELQPLVAGTQHERRVSIFILEVDLWSGMGAGTRGKRGAAGVQCDRPHRPCG